MVFLNYRGNDSSSFVDANTPVAIIDADAFQEMEYYDLLPKTIREALANSHREIATKPIYVKLEFLKAITEDEVLSRISTANRVFEDTTNKLLANGLYFKKTGDIFL